MKTILSVIFFIIGYVGFSQQPFSFRVIDEEGQPLEGVYVSASYYSIDSIGKREAVVGFRNLHKHGGQAMETNQNGELALSTRILSIPENVDTLTVELRLLGYENQSVKLVRNQFKQITLQVDIEMMDAITVVGNSVGYKPEVLSNGYTLSRYRLEDESANTLAEAMDALPGVHAINTGVGIAKPMVRGFVGTRVQVYNQGIQQEGQQWGKDHGLEVDQFSVSDMRVVTGPEAVIHGPASVSGAVYLTPKNYYPDYSDRTWIGEVRLLGKTNNALLGQSANLTYKNGHSQYFAMYTVQDFADYRVPADTFNYNTYNLALPDGILKNTAGNEENFAISYLYAVDSLHVRAWAGRYHQKVGLFPGATGIPRAFDISNIGDQRDVNTPFQETTHDNVNLEIEKSNLNHVHKWNFGWQHNHREERSQPHSHGLNYIDSSNTLGLGLDLHTAEAKYTYTHRNAKRSFNVGGNLQGQINTQTGWEFLIPSYQQLEYSAFGLWQRKFKGVTYNLGARLDGASLSSESYSQPWYNKPDSLVERTAGIDKSWLVPTVSFGMSYEKSDWIYSGHLSYQSRIPSVPELASNGVHHGTFRHEIGNPDLDPERGVLMEITTLKQYNQSSFKFTVFGSLFQNYIFLDPSGEFSPLPDAGQIYGYRQAPMRQYGAELYLGLVIYDNLESSWMLNVTGDMIMSQNSELGLPLPFQPPMSLSLTPEYRFTINRSSAARVGLESQLVNAQNQVAINERPTPGYVLFNLYANSDFRFSNRTGLKLTLRAQNLLNTEYRRHLSRYRILNLPEQGFNLIAQIAFTF